MTDLLHDTKLRQQLHAVIRKVMLHHKLTKVADAVVEADLIDAVLTITEARQIETKEN
jgi:hypothetical protein